MQHVATIAHSLFSRFTHWLVLRHGARYVLAGTMGLAGVGALAANHVVPSLPNPSAITSALHLGDRDGYHDGWFWHRQHHGYLHYGGRGWSNVPPAPGYGGGFQPQPTQPNGSGSSGSYVNVGGNGGSY